MHFLVERVYTGDVNTLNHDQRQLESKNYLIFVRFWEILSYQSQEYMKLFKGCEVNTAEVGQPVNMVVLTSGWTPTIHWRNIMRNSAMISSA